MDRVEFAAKAPSEQNHQTLIFVILTKKQKEMTDPSCTLLTPLNDLTIRFTQIANTHHVVAFCGDIVQMCKMHTCHGSSQSLWRGSKNKPRDIGRWWHDDKLHHTYNLRKYAVDVVLGQPSMSGVPRVGTRDTCAILVGKEASGGCTAISGCKFHCCS